MLTDKLELLSVFQVPLSNFLLPIPVGLIYDFFMTYIALFFDSTEIMLRLDQNIFVHIVFANLRNSNEL